MKNRLKGAQKGHSLLKRKSEALTRRFREIVTKIQDVSGSLFRILNKSHMNSMMSDILDVGKIENGKADASRFLFLCASCLQDR